MMNRETIPLNLQKRSIFVSANEAQSRKWNMEELRTNIDGLANRLEKWVPSLHGDELTDSVNAKLSLEVITNAISSGAQDDTSHTFADIPTPEVTQMQSKCTEILRHFWASCPSLNPYVSSDLSENQRMAKYARMATSVKTMLLELERYMQNGNDIGRMMLQGVHVCLQRAVAEAG